MMSTERNVSRPIGLIVVVALFVSLSGLLVWWVQPSTEQLLQRARGALAQSDYQQAEGLVAQILAYEPNSSSAHLLAARIAAEQGKVEQAISHYTAVTEDVERNELLELIGLGEMFLSLNLARQAEGCFRHVLAVDPRNARARLQLARLLGIEGRRWEAQPHLLELLRMQYESLEVLLYAGNRAATANLPRRLEAMLKANPNDPTPRIGLARIAMQRGRVERAIRLLRNVLVDAPEMVEAHALLGLAWTEIGSFDEIVVWEAGLPPRADSHPGVWMARGMWAKSRDQSPAAVRCFWEAVRLDPSHQAANYQLSQTLHALEKSEAAQAFEQRALRLHQLVALLDLIQSDPANTHRLRKAAQLNVSLGRLWEANGWYRMLLQQEPRNTAAKRELDRLQAFLSPEAPLTIPSANPSRQFDGSHWPLPEWSDVSSSRPDASGPPQSAGLLFRDRASTAGIDFAYFAGRPPSDQGRRMQEVTGGGVAVIDFDADGWPDLYFTQGCPWPPDPIQRKYLDRLYRNLGDGRFEDITEHARVMANGFGQGVTTGDFNSDGLADLYVANIGRNQLLINNGDGTFCDATEIVELTASAWTTSCLLADLDGDGHPDIYDVNYVEGEDVFDRLCHRADIPRACTPRSFSPQQDQILRNRGDGRVEEIASAPEEQLPASNGLGIVAADLDHSGRLSLFVANDQDANFLLFNRTASPGASLRFEQQGVLAGVAFDQAGIARATMGVAAGDATGDGKLDLFVTNFYGEANTLYVQEQQGIFSDATRRANLFAAGYASLGFGTQFIDGELDGHLDLVVTNGHIDDFTHRGIPFRMKPQYLRNAGEGRFEEIDAETLGSYFQSTYLGRGLARLDWNRDGREDFAVSHIESSASLVSNEVGPAGHYLAVELRGVQSARDAIGATVALTSQGTTWVRQLTAGDGYQASNQRRLVFGLGQRTRVDALVVHWPSTSEQIFHDLPIDADILLVEGRPQWLPLQTTRVPTSE